MKICDVTQFFNPLSGGVKRYLLSKSTYIQSAQGLEHVLIVPGEKDSITTSGPCTIHTIKSPRIPGTQSYRFIYRIRRIQTILEMEKPDLVEVGDPYQLGWAVARLGKKLQLPVISFYHSDYPRALERTVKRFAGNYAAKWAHRALGSYIVGLYNRMTATFVASPQTLHTLEQCGIQRLHLTPIGIETQTFSPQSSREKIFEELKIHPDRFLLLYVGRMSREKNIDILLDLIDLLSHTTPNQYHLLMVGQGHLEHKVRRTGEMREDVTWLPYCSDSSKLAEIYSAADLFLHAGATETYGLTVLEAQSCGTPVVALRGGGTDVLNLAGEDFLAPGRSPGAFQRTIKAVRPRITQELKNQIRQQIVERFDAENCFKHQIDIYTQLLQTPIRVE